MELISFVVKFFASKHISSLTALTCWPPDRSAALVLSAGAAGMRTRVLTAGPRAPALLSDGLGREGVLLDEGCPHAAELLDKASESRAFVYRYTWLLLHDSFLNASIAEELLGSLEMLPDSDVTWWSRDAALEVYRVKAGRPLVWSALRLASGDTLGDMLAMWGTRASPGTRRGDLGRVTLKGVTVISEPQNFKGWQDLTDRETDTFPKFTYPLLMLLAEDLNYRYNLVQLDLYGSETVPGGQFSGLAGLLQRGEAELGVTSMFMRSDRLRALHFVSETVELRGAFLFRQPPQSSVSNVYLLPFSRGVWASSAGVLVAAAVLLAVLARVLRRHQPQLRLLTVPETFSFAVGILCQQGFHLAPGSASARLVMFSSLVSSLFAFTAYSAKVVSILQAPSAALLTVDQLARSPLALGVQNTTYRRVYFEESNEEATQRLYRRKLVPLGEHAYLSAAEGVERVRTGLYAFQVELSAGYELVSRTFTEREKCGLREIQAFRLPMVAVPLRKHCGYRELIATRLRWQREVGLVAAARARWLAAKPRCEARAAGFLSIGLADVSPALQILGYGALVACSLLAAELTWARRGRARQASPLTSIPTLDAPSIYVGLGINKGN